MQPVDEVLVKETLAKYPIAKNGTSEELLKFVKETDSLLSSQASPVYLGVNNFVKGSYFTGASNFKLALKYLNQVEKNLEKFPAYDSLRFASYLFLSEVHNSLGDFNESMKQALKAKDGFEKLEMPIGVYSANLAIGKMYQTKGEIKKAKEIIKTNTHVSIDYIKLKSLHILANIYGEQGEIDSALAIDNEIIFNKEEHTSKNVSPFYNNKALCLTMKNQFDSAVYFFSQSLFIDSVQQNPQNLCANYGDMGSMYLMKGDFDSAKYYTIKSLTISKQIGKKVITLANYKTLYELNKMDKNYPVAILYGDSVNRLQKELDNVAVNTGIEEMNLVYETSKKEKTIQKQHDTIERNKILFGGILIVLIITSLFLYNLNRKVRLKQQLANVALQQKNEKAIAEAENKERQRISRDLHDNMGAYTSALIANIEKFTMKSGDETELAKMQNNASQILNSLRETIWVLSNKDVSITDFNDEFKSYCFKVLKNFEHFDFIATEEILTNKKLPASTAIHLNKILQEAVQNIIKHSNGHEIQYHLTCDKKLEIQIKDNGVGFNPEKVKRGNGLENMEWRAREAQVEIKFQENEQSGMTIKITEV